MDHTIEVTKKKPSERPSGNGMKKVLNFVHGQFVESQVGSWLPVMNPSVGQQIAQVSLSSSREVDDAVKAAQTAFPQWSAIPIKERAQIFYRYKTLLEKNLSELAEQIHEENGKVMSEAIAEVEKSIEVTEFASSMPQLS